MFMPHQGAADPVYGVVDDSDGWGVASGFDPSGGEPMYQAGGLWVSFCPFRHAPTSMVFSPCMWEDLPPRCCVAVAEVA